MSTEQDTNGAASGGSGLNDGLGVWTLVSPDGRIFKAETPLKCCALEMRERVPPELQLARIQEAITCKKCGDRLVGHEDESDTECRWCVTGWKPCPDNGVPMTPNDQLPDATPGSQRVNPSHPSAPVERWVMQFDELALGARFIYANSPEKNQQIWIKISGEGCGIIAEYDENRIVDKNWIGQHICSAKEYENEDLLVEFVA